ncbi:Mg-dependent DNase TatD [Thermoanaerobacter kivui]|uniref:Mg-dependent DNase TatD n=1 Tax=Thermoanaerobacter kivui TaxID=2325 RepID=A0A097AQQ1_THEKI|nr:TatD family hydrolase [Thermoanaerobacter kivui]AIS52135.1 Mg-dependent DNase TatD [Thermoanaerobacter kivui]
MIDTHAHMDNIFYLRDRDKVIKNAIEKGIKHIITIGINVDSSKQSIQLAEKYPQIYASVGIHPQCVNQLSDESVLNKIEQLAKHPKVVAIGEAGLDYKYGQVNDEFARRIFIGQIQIAKKRELPIIIHSWLSHNEVIEILTKEGVPRSGGIIHCFDEDWETAKKYLSLGMYISLSGICTYKENSFLLEVIEKTPIEKLLLETDSPYISPEPNRTKRNNPSRVLDVAKFVSEVRKEPFEYIKEKVTENAKKIFKI